MHAVDDSRTSEEGSENRQTESSDHQTQVPDPQHSATLLNKYRMQIGSSCEPWQEARIFHWVPRPYTAPTENFVTPPTTKDDAYC